MAVRNFWIDADIDGRATMLGGGPRSKDGGMDITIYQRDEGGIKRAFTINCRAYGSKLITTVRNDADSSCEVMQLKTDR